MSIENCNATGVGQPQDVAVPPTSSQPLQRLGAMRRQQGISRRTMAGRLNIEIEQVRQQEESSDPPLSVVWAWQKVLNMPIAELLVDAGDGPPVLKRSQFVQLMKTVLEISKQTRQEPVRRIAQTMVGQLVEIMPELAGFAESHTADAQRHWSELGAAAQRRLGEEVFVDHTE